MSQTRSSQRRLSLAASHVHKSVLTLALLLTASLAHSQDKVLVSFSGTGNGSKPQCILAMDSHGNLYGTTATGGDVNGGLVFKVTPHGGGVWTEETIYSFDSAANGTGPTGGVVLDVAGNVYGTTVSGGALGLGTAFELSPQSGSAYTETVIHSFGDTGDGIFPSAQMIFDAAGNLYGTTLFGEAFGTGEEGGGTVFELSPQSGGTWSEEVLHSWTETIIHNFAGGTADGRLPESGVTLDAAGNVYGTTVGGGKYARGIVFELVPQGGGVWSEKGLHAFGNGLDGANPEGEVLLDAAGNIYGTTFDGGKYGVSYGGVGTLYELSQTAGIWSEARLFNFGSTNKDAGYPMSGLIFDPSGNIYGTSTGGGEVGNGTVYKIKP
ncbi:MAG: choice-of-anchor tandem repeat GloVer-containing protein [Candidatus Sulfotelmatobacter sp.]